MEKLKPHYELKKIKSLLCDEKTREITRISRQGAATLGYMDVEDMLTIIETLTQRNFYKSMTTRNDTTVWQDVYKISDESETKLYIKLQLSFNKKKAIVIQFKRDSGED